MGTHRIKHRDVSAEELPELQKLSRAELNKKVEAELPASITCGYGYYGCRLANDGNGKWWIEIDVGTSCD